MRLVARVLLIAGAVAGAAAEVWTVRSGWPWTSAALDLLAGWSLLAAGGLARHVSAGCRAMLGLSGACWFLATPEVVGGRPGHDAALLGALWVAPLATALLGSPDPVPARVSQRAVAIAFWVRAVPVLAEAAWLTAALGACLAAVAMLDVRCYAVRVPRAGAAVLGAVIGAAGLVQATAGRGSALEPLIAVSVTGCAVAMLVVRPVPVETGSGLAGLVVELGRTKDALSLERRLGRAIGDPRLRLLYQLAPGLPLVTASGLPAGATPRDRAVTVLGEFGAVVAVLEHERTALDDHEVRQAVQTVARLAVRRLVRASEAARQSVELAESRRRLVQAEQSVLQQFASDVADGPGQSLAQCLAALDEALAATPASLRPDVAAAYSAGLAAQEDLARTAAGNARAMSAGTLPAALLDLAGSVGAGVDLRIDGDFDDEIASAAWFAASEAIANALKHAGPARIWLSAATEDCHLVVEVADDGVGGADPDGRGLRSLADRLAASGGRLQVRGDVHGGTRVIADLPLTAGQQAGAARARPPGHARARPSPGQRGAERTNSEPAWNRLVT